MVMKYYSILIGLVSLGVLVYVYAVPPQSMQVSRQGVPHYTPKVLHPETGEPLDINDLVRHYKGTDPVDFESTLHLIMFVVAFGIMYVTFTSD